MTSTRALVALFLLTVTVGGVVMAVSAGLPSGGHQAVAPDGWRRVGDEPARYVGDPLPAK